MAKAMIEVEIPDGYEFDRFGVPNSGEYVFFQDDVVQVGALTCKHIIVRKVEPVTELVVRFKPGWIAMDRSGIWHWYDFKPRLQDEVWGGDGSYRYEEITCFVMPVTDWKQSLMRVG